MNDRARTAAKRIKERVKPKPTRERAPVTLYLDTDLFKAFKRECEALNSSASKMFEEFMREFSGEK